MFRSKIAASRVVALSAVLATLTAVIAPGVPVAQPAPPNVVVVMTDDLSVDVTDALLAGGWLPNIQQYLIDGGVSFEESFVTNALCCPSRATYLRGQYSHTHRIIGNRYGCELDSIELPGWFPSGGNPGRNESTLATWLQASGYVTGYIGKYLNGYGEVSPPGGPADPELYIPPGWDHWQGLISPGGYRMYDYAINDNGTVVNFGSDEADYQTDVLAARAVDFIEERAAGPEPFFLSIMPFAPHIEILNAIAPPPCGQGNPGADTIRPAPRHAVYIDGDPGNGEIPDLFEKPSYNEADLSDKPQCAVDPVFGPQCVGDRNLMGETAQERIRNQYKGMASSMLAVDDLVGGVMQALTAAGIENSTVVVFTSDNGWYYGEHRLNTKDFPYEEAIRVPLYVRAPGALAGNAVTKIVLNNDLAVTLAEIGGAGIPYVPDGTSFAPLLSNPAANWGRVRFLVEHYYQPPGNWATFAALRQIAANDILYVQTYGSLTQPSVITAREFYNLAGDPYQLNSVALDPSITAVLDQLLGVFRACEGHLCRLLEGF